MRMDKLTSKFQLAIADAQSLAVGRDHQMIDPVHLMSALIDQEGGTVKNLLSISGVDVQKLRSGLFEIMEKLPQVQGINGDVRVSNDLAKLLNVKMK